MKIALALSGLVLLSASLVAQEGQPVGYRLMRSASPAVEYWWENQRLQDIPTTDLSCNLDPGTAFPYSFTVADPTHPGRVCLWVGGPAAEIFLTMRTDRRNTFALRQRFTEWEPWSDVAETVIESGTVPRPPTGLSVVIP